MKKDSIFDLADLSGIGEEVFSAILSTPSVKLERIVSKGQVTPEGFWYDQNLDEWVILLRGEATILFENAETVNLMPGDYLLIPAHAKHRVTYTSSDPECVWLALHGELK